MKTSVILLLVAYSVSAGRLRRQVAGDSGAFWWLQGGNSAGTEASIIPENASEDTRLNPNSEAVINPERHNNPGHVGIPPPPPPPVHVGISPQPACECVPYYLCDDGEVNTDGSGIIDIRYCTFFYYVFLIS